MFEIRNNQWSDFVNVFTVFADVSFQNSEHDYCVNPIVSEITVNVDFGILKKNVSVYIHFAKVVTFRGM